MIEASGLTKRYGAKTAVDRISFTIEPGTVTGFLGPNGAGKSTTMRLIMGLDKPTEGSVKINGRSYQDLAVAGLLPARPPVAGLVAGHGGVAVGRHRLGRGGGAAAVEGGAAGEERITHL